MSTEQLLIDLLDAKPDEGAKILATRSPDDVAPILRLLDGNQSARLLSQVPPKIAAEWLYAVKNNDTIKAFFAHVDIEIATHIVASVPVKHRQRILAPIGKRQARIIQLRLQQHFQGISDLVDRTVLTLTPEITVEQAKKLLGKRLDHFIGETIFVLDAKLRLAGQVSLAALLTAKDSNMIKSLLQPVKHSVNIQSEIHTLAKYDIWHDCIQLPVINQQDKFLGLIKRSDIELHISTVSVNNPLEDLLLAIFDLVSLVWRATADLLISGMNGKRST